MKLTEAQREFLTRVQSEDGFGVVRAMPANQRRTGYSLKDKGLVMLDGVISSAITEGATTYSGLTFVITEAGRRVLEDKEQ